jgi:hypothetical protein
MESRKVPEWRHLAIASVLIATPSVPMAGELECMLGCRLDGLTNISWKPSSMCSKPFVPSFYASTPEQYNMAVDTYNRWLSQMKAYVECVNAEASSDLKKLPNIVVEGAKKAQQEASDEISSARSRLQMMRPMR